MELCDWWVVVGSNVLMWSCGRFKRCSLATTAWGSLWVWVVCKLGSPASPASPAHVPDRTRTWLKCDMGNRWKQHPSIRDHRSSIGGCPLIHSSDDVDREANPVDLCDDISGSPSQLLCSPAQTGSPMFEYCDWGISQNRFQDRKTFSL